MLPGEQKWSLTRLGEFVARDEEQAFREASADTYRALNYLIGGTVLLGAVGFNLNDITWPEVDWYFVGPRLALALLILPCLAVNYRARSWRAIYFVTGTLSVGVSMTVAAIDYLRPPDFLLHLGVDVLVVMGIYMALPTIRLQILLASSYAGGLILIHFMIKEPAYAQANVTVPLSLVLASVMGVGAAIMQSRLRRQLFAQMQSERLTRQALERVQSEVAALSALLPMCSSCKKVRDDTGYWNQVDSYLQSISGQQVSHGLCPECMNHLLDDEVQ